MQMREENNIKYIFPAVVQYCLKADISITLCEMQLRCVAFSDRLCDASPAACPQSFCNVFFLLMSSSLYTETYYV